MFEFMDSHTDDIVIKVIAVGGGGGNAVAHMMHNGIECATFIALDTDARALARTGASITLLLGIHLCQGIGTHGDLELGRAAALSEYDRLRELLIGADWVFIVAGMGGGTGSGASPIVADVARELGILTVAVVTPPFTDEDPLRTRCATHGYKALRAHVDTLITIPCDKTDASEKGNFKAANIAMMYAVRYSSELNSKRGIVGVDFADVSTVLRKPGAATIAMGYGAGANRTKEAVESVISHLTGVELTAAKGVVCNIICDYAITLKDFEYVGNALRERVSEHCYIVVGVTVETPEEMPEMCVTVIVTGIEADPNWNLTPIECI